MLYDAIDWIRTHAKLCLMMLVCLLVAFGVYSVITQISRQGKVAVKIDVFPSDATVDIDKYGESGNGTIYLEPGTYSYKISGEGYTSRKSTLHAREDQGGYIYTVLAKEEGEYKSRDIKKIERIEAKAGAESRKYTEQFKRDHPITDYLPIKDAYYSIGYLVDDGGDNFRITVYTESPRYRNIALKRIRSIGEDPSKYRIDFMDYKNPLTGGNR